ncbi:MAG: hypothetical protein AVDCRST_MAG74-916 [uncultured Pyrinomonadaceae bacterium]|uniref:Uncharacterized protein n=1 Tax=uncultured Pyrinomonadaceae bacterium TaxID=2283094 RepID=A0A6J4NJ66_9BACT|nr:MAG: hypothetical protein AVDCRST_MAG74-916 [uncultured Pyrinomonadaceae bacterium]
MTENQEKELFNTLAALVTGVNVIQSEVKVIKTDIQEIKVTQDEHSRILNEHSGILNEHSGILNEHSRILTRLDAKTDSIAETVLNNDKRLTAVEKDVSNLRGGIH